MPVEQRSTSRQSIAVVLAVVLLVLVGVGAWALVNAASQRGSGVTLRLGDDVFDAGQAVRLARQIRADGPVLFSDVSGRGQARPIYVQHFGDDAATRWVAFTAVAPGAAPGCFLSWSATRQRFEERQLTAADGRRTGERCRPTTWSSSGDGLTQYPWRIDAAGDLLVDLRTPRPSTTTTTIGD